MTPGDAETNVLLEHGFDEDVKLPNNSRVRFQTERGYFSIHHRSDLPHGIAVYGHGNYLWDVVILPQAANSVYLCFRPDPKREEKKELT